MLAIPLLAHADEEEPFFDKDFAKSPERDATQLEQHHEAEAPTTIPKIPRTTSTATNDLSERVKDIVGKARSNGQNPDLPTQTAPLPGSKQTMQVAVVGGILDATNHELLTKQLADFVTIVREAKILISTIYCIGPRIELPIKTLYEITKYQGRILFVDEQPKKYQEVKQSPTWILSSLDQEIIIEGAGLLSENLNVKGEITTRATEKITPKAVSNDKDKKTKESQEQ